MKPSIRHSTAVASGAAVVLVLSVTAAVPADPLSSTVLANTCFSCHGTDGASQGAMPPIKGKSATYIESQLTAFRDGTKKATLMNRIAKGFTAAEIAALSRYFAARK